MSGTIRIAIAIEDRLQRDLLSNALAKHEIRTTGYASSFQEIEELLSDETPDILLFDLRIPDVDSSNLAKIRRKFPELKIMLLSRISHTYLGCQYLIVKDNALVTKNIGFAALLHILREFDAPVRSLPVSFVQHRFFTKKEEQIIPFLCAGETLKTIALRIGVSEKAIEAHRQRIYKKTQSVNRTGFLHCVLKDGLSDLIYWNRYMEFTTDIDTLKQALIA